MRTISKAIIATALLASGAIAIAATATPGSADAEQRLRAAGFAEVRELELDDGIWEADVRRADGTWDEVAVDAATGEVLDARDGRPLLDATAIRAALEGAGYRDVNELDREGAIWEADARDAQGQAFELRVSAFDARIVSATPDDDGDDD
jgi:uncharacterized membrane protein YkoI